MYAKLSIFSLAVLVRAAQSLLIGVFFLEFAWGALFKQSEFYPYSILHRGYTDDVLVVCEKTPSIQRAGPRRELSRNAASWSSSLLPWF